MKLKNHSKIAAITASIATLAGFCIVLFLPSIYKAGTWGIIVVTGQIMLLPIGLLAAALIGLVVYFVFKKFIRNKIAYASFLVMVIVLCILLGVWLNIIVFRALTNVGLSRPIVVKIDANGDGKVDKWIYEERGDKTIEVDTDYDGIPDVREYYKNKRLIKRKNIPSPKNQ